MTALFRQTPKNSGGRPLTAALTVLVTAWVMGLVVVADRWRRGVLLGVVAVRPDPGGAGRPGGGYRTGRAAARLGVGRRSAGHLWCRFQFVSVSTSWAYVR